MMRRKGEPYESNKNRFLYCRQRKEQVKETSEQNLKELMRWGQKKRTNQFLASLCCGMGIGLMVASFSIVDIMIRNFCFALSAIALMVGFYLKGRQ